MYWNLTDELRDDLWFITDTLYKDKTNLPVIVWLSCSHLDMNIPCIFFQNSYSDEKLSYNELDNLITMRIDNQELLLNSGEKININENDIQKIKEWVKLHKNIIMNYWNGEIGTFRLIDEGLL